MQKGNQQKSVKQEDFACQISDTVAKKLFNTVSDILPKK